MTQVVITNELGERRFCEVTNMLDIDDDETDDKDLCVKFVAKWSETQWVIFDLPIAEFEQAPS